MPETLTREQVIALAPDAASAKAASGLATEGKWPLLGADEEALWGECQGSGSRPYQTQVDLNALVSRCTCPSRKFPCKHGLALLLLFSQGGPRFVGGRPAWVEEWVNGRRERAEKKEQVAAAPKTVDPQIAAAAELKREAARWKRIEGGTRDLERWICDRFRRGFAQIDSEQRAEWSTMVARMVDAQAPGLAALLQRALDTLARGTTHYADAIEQLGLIQLLNDAVSRRDALSESRRADIRAALGWPLEKDDVVSASEGVRDEWQVVGQCIVDVDTQLAERRVWLHGIGSGRQALIQEFAYAGKGWSVWRPLAHYAATLHFYPGSVPLRAVAIDAAPATPSQARVAQDTAASIEFLSRSLALNPWLPQLPLICNDMTPSVDHASWHGRTSQGDFRLALKDDAAWSLLAFSGGHALATMGEWDGHRYRVLSAVSADGSTWFAGADT